MRSGPWLRLAAIFAAAGLAGCNLVVSHTPIFTEADANGAPKLKPGVWAAPEPDCKFDETQPAASWPSCASGSVVTATHMKSPVDPAHPPTAAKPNTPYPYVLAAGDPPVVQVMAPTAGDSGLVGPLYFFIALKPLSRDAGGLVDKAEQWPIQCGPPPPKPKAGSTEAGKTESYVTDHPLPGMTVDGSLCTPRDKAAVLDAAQPSRAWTDPIQVTHWVRAGDR
ncbi:MAG: hypothetical protein ACHP84_14260 [Caulobacterales bacterium]